MSPRPGLLFYCQHSLGMGHLVRSLALATALAQRFHVVFLNGGPLPRGLKLSEHIELVSLPPLGMAADSTLFSHDRRRTVERAQQLRSAQIMHLWHTVKPQVLLIELFPFGRKKFAFELLPLLEAASNITPVRPVVICSLRDILVGQRRDQQHHDERASTLVNRYFDAVLVHTDPTFARLEESFAPQTPLRVPVSYSGFVLPDNVGQTHLPPPASPTIVVSAGGGIVGEPLFRAALEAHALLYPTTGLHLKIIAGPFLPAAAWQHLRRTVQGQRGLTLRRFVPDVLAELRRATASVSQCGYNTALDILRAQVPALVVPYAVGREDEQTRRARRLERLGAIRLLEPSHLNGANLAAAIQSLQHFHPRPVHLDLAGAAKTVQFIASLLHERQHNRIPADALYTAGGTQ